MRAIAHQEVGDVDREEALKLLRGGPEGIREWNRLRAESGVVPTRLNRADLAGVNLYGANLSQVDLGGASLRGARIHQDYSIWASFRGSDRTSAINLSVHGTDFTGAVLRCADLQ